MNISKPYKVEFNDGPYNGAIRYYSTFSLALRSARKYVKNRISGRILFAYPSCEIFFVDNNGVSKFLAFITN